MKEQDFQKIFKWLYGDSFSHNGFDYYIDGQPIGGSASIILSLNEDKYVHKFESKLIMDLKTNNQAHLVQIDVSVYDNKYVTRYMVFDSVKKTVSQECAGTGITRNESILNAVLDYVNNCA